MNRYANKRHRGPTHRGFTQTEYGVEGRIPVVLAVKPTKAEQPSTIGEFVPDLHIRAFYRHPTKGWRSTGPEGRR